MRSSGGARSASSRVRPCLQAVSSTVRRTAGFRAPSGLRTRPEIFCCPLEGAQRPLGLVVGCGNRGIAGEGQHARPVVPPPPHPGGPPASFPPAAGIRARRCRRPRCCQSAARAGRPAAPARGFHPTGSRRGQPGAARGPLAPPRPQCRHRPGPGGPARDAPRRGRARFPDW